MKQDKSQDKYLWQKMYIFKQNLSNDYNQKQFLTCKASDTYSRRHVLPTTTRSRTLACAHRHLHTGSLLTKRKGGWEDEKEEAEVLGVFGCLNVQKHVWKSINGCLCAFGCACTGICSVFKTGASHSCVGCALHPPSELTLSSFQTSAHQNTSLPSAV